jgi:hypothetical protein
MSIISVPMNTHQLQAEYPFNPDRSAPFGSREEMIAAMSSPKYRQDPAYQETVAARLAVSDRVALGTANHRPLIKHTFIGEAQMNEDNLDLLPAARRYQAPERTTTALPFTSREEALGAMGDPRYKTDDAYRADVQERYAATSPEIRR